MKLVSFLPKAAGVALSVALLSAGSLYAQEIRFINITTATTGGGAYPAGVALAKVLQDKLGIRTSAQSSSGSVENVDILRNNEANIGFIQVNHVQQAINATGAFEGKEKADFMVLSPSLIAVDQVLVRKDANINSLSDLKGKRFCMGRVGSGTLEYNRELLMAVNLTEADVTPLYLGANECLTLLREGGADATNLASGIPISGYTETLMIAGKDLKFLSLTPEEQEGYFKASGYKLPYVMPAGSYEGLTEDVNTSMHTNLFTVRSDFPEQLAYDIVKTIYENLDELIAATNTYSVLNPQFAYDAIKKAGVPMHPGAERYYKEVLGDKAN